ncbi:hypothetical protein FBQ96_03965 [Nitrospirales bacterium NOB]|nr:MAG: hypothetical protein UZ03_NOB001000442 [Nitrospira sp. OLB3]MBV6470709.1 hypothetical protein [Nitrospirota bacterium]MCE7964875.1 hypothetical protein [Nitrospira sp. NTP2]MCK6492317.1 hypothetical protein [Nitrospira sp.]MDL1888733.1 hypothetical protein [Nitrospirales bacterium NOB]MEB2338040.1 hypothetical protein [Nitrospirales bacterium]
MLKHLLLTLCLLSPILEITTSPEVAHAAMAYTRVSIEAIDLTVPRITFRTIDGQVWTVQAISVDVIRDVQKGDTCSLELDPEDRVIKVIKLSPPAP